MTPALPVAAAVFREAGIGWLPVRTLLAVEAAAGQAAAVPVAVLTGADGC